MSRPNRHRSLFARLGTSLSEIAGRAGIGPKKLKNFLEPRRLPTKEQEQIDLMESVSKLLPEDERSGFARIVAEQKLGEMSFVLVRMDREIRRLREENRRLKEAMRVKDDTSSTVKPAVKRIKN